MDKEKRNAAARARYRVRKVELTQQAIEWQSKFSEGEVLYYSDIAEACEYFRYWGTRYGLIREFKENGIL